MQLSKPKSIPSYTILYPKTYPSPQKQVPTCLHPFTIDLYLQTHPFTGELRFRADDLIEKKKNNKQGAVLSLGAW